MHFPRLSRRKVLGGLIGAPLIAQFPLSARAQQAKSLIIGSSNATSSQYAISVAMMKAFKAGIPNTDVTLIETGASVDNLRRLARGEISLGLTGLEIGIQAREGIGIFAGKPIPDVVGLYAYDHWLLNVVVRADSEIKTLYDLQGKRFSPGLKGAGTEVLIRGTLDALGVEPIWVPGSVQDAVEGFQNRQVVGFVKSSPSHGVDSVVREIMVTTPVKLLGYDQKAQDYVTNKIKGLDLFQIPAEHIPGQTPVVTPRGTVIYAARASQMSDDTAAAIAHAIDKQRAVLVETWGHLAKFDFAKTSLNTEKIGLPLHPGAKRYWQSVA